MAKQNKPTLKTYFLTGATPTEQQYKDLIDSFVHLDDQAAVDAQIVSQLLQTYDQNLKSRNTNGPIDTLGDVFAFLEGLQDNTKLLDRLNTLNWNQLPGKPATVNLELVSQYLDTSITKFDPQPRVTPTPGTVLNNPATTYLLNLNGIDANVTPTIIKDIQIQRRFISIPTGGSPIEFYTEMIVGLIVCVAPKAKLN